MSLQEEEAEIMKRLQVVFALVATMLCVAATDRRLRHPERSSLTDQFRDNVRSAAG